jgi:hypothetical protein
LPTIAESLDLGVLELWSVEVLKKDIKTSAITPILQYSEAVEN